MAKPEQYFMGLGRNYPRSNVMLSDYTNNPRFALGEFRLWLSEALNFQCESIYENGVLSVWGTKSEQYISHMKEWLSKNGVDFDVDTAIESRFGVNDTEQYKTKITILVFEI